MTTPTPTQISSALEFVVRFSNGDEQRVDTYPEAVALLRAAGCEVTAHDGDLESGGGCTFGWLTEADAVADADDVSRVYANISGRYDTLR